MRYVPEGGRSMNSLTEAGAGVEGTVGPEGVPVYDVFKRSDSEKVRFGA